MSIRIDRDRQWAPWWAAADGRITKMGGDPESEWIDRRIGALMSYDAGQILDLYLESISGLRDVNILEFPGGEVCSSFLASFFDCGNHGIGRPGLAEWEGCPHVRETADIHPGHPGISKWFAICDPGEALKPGYWIMHINNDPIGPDVKRQLLELIARLIASRANLAAIIKAYNDARHLFRDGIKQVGRDYFGLPDPFYKATHSSLIWRVDYKNMIVRCISQEINLRQIIIPLDDIHYKMRKKPPEFIVAKPLFLYG